MEHKSARIEFKFEGNKRQYEFNSDLEQELESMKSKIETTSTEDLEEQLEHMVKKLRHRNKLMKIADRSEGCWTTVYEYERGDVADNSDDEKKIRRAESRAVKRKRFLPRRQADSSRQQLPQRQSLLRAFSSEKEETAIVRQYAHDSASISDLRTAVLCLLSYAGFLRFNETIHIRRSDISFNETFCRIYLP